MEEKGQCYQMVPQRRSREVLLCRDELAISKPKCWCTRAREARLEVVWSLEPECRWGHPPTPCTPGTGKTRAWEKQLRCGSEALYPRHSSSTFSSPVFWSSLQTHVAFRESDFTASCEMGFLPDQYLGSLYLSQANVYLAAHSSCPNIKHPTFPFLPFPFLCVAFSKWWPNLPSKADGHIITESQCETEPCFSPSPSLTEK